MELEFIKQTKEMVDSLKSICSNHGLGNDGNEYKIITQLFLYKFLNDKFVYEIKQLDESINNSDNWEKVIEDMPEDDYEMLLMRLHPSSARLKKEHFLSHLHNEQNKSDFHVIFDSTLLDISATNADRFSIKTESKAQIKLFDELSQFITDPSGRDDFCRSIVNRLVNFSFEKMFSQKYDFFATIFEYVIQDYNTNGGGKYAEYYTPHSVARIMAKILVDEEVSNVTCYDPSAGSGTLLMNVAHEIGEDKCSIYSQDISQKSSGMLRLNLTLNNLVHSIPNIIQGNTIKNPYHKESDNVTLKKFDYIVSNPPFKLDFSSDRDEIENRFKGERFFAGVPNIPKTKKESMAIYLLFIQHIMFSLSNKGRAAIVVPTGFITAQTGIEKKVRERLVESKMLKGVVSMPSNIFATTGTNVSVLFLDKNNKDDVVLMDASKLGTTVKEGKNQKTILSEDEENLIIDIFNNKEAKEDLSVVVSYDEIKEKNCSFSAGQYFDIKIEYVDITKEEFDKKINYFKENLKGMFEDSKELEDEINNQLGKLKYD